MQAYFGIGGAAFSGGDGRFFNPPFPMKLLRTLGCLFTLAAAALAAKPPEVELVVESGTLQPSGTVEVRFARAMVGQDSLGVPVAESPLVFTPALPGSFTWLSTRSGVYAPSAVPVLGTGYKVTLRAGLKDAGGAAVAAELAKVLKTPPFQVSAGMQPGEDDEELSPLPAEKVAFNLSVKLEGAEKFFEFVADDGRKVAATVRYATSEDYFSIPDDAEDWNDRWQKAHSPAGAEKKGDEGEDARPRPNRLVVQPVALLAAGPLWRLEMKPGLEARDGGRKIAERRVLKLGRVQPFTLKLLKPASYVHSGRSLVLEFSKELAPDVDEKTAGKFFRVTPEPPNLRFEVNGEWLTIHGDFERGADYRLTIDPSLLAESGQPFAGERARPFRFAPVKPRVYLPTITAEQLRGGERKLPIRTVNLQSVRITARLVAPEAAAQAIEAFKKYTKEIENEEDATDELYQALPPGAIKAAPLAERTVELPGAALDARQETVVDWTELLGEKKAGVIFLTAEGQPLAAAGGGKTRPAAQALIQLTDLGVLWKKTGRELRTTVFSMASGQPVAGASVAVFKKDFSAVLASATTDAEGTAGLPLNAGIGWLLVRHGEDAHALRMGEGTEFLPKAGGYPDWRVTEPAPQLRGLLFTDRPLYRPGETVHVKGLVRMNDNGVVKLDAPPRPRCAPPAGAATRRR